MIEIGLTTPALLFSAVSLILLAYTNRFLGYAQIIRNLYAELKKNKDAVLLDQINNLRKRLYLIRSMQLFGAGSLFLSMLSMMLIYVNLPTFGSLVFLFGILSMVISIAISVWEIYLSVGALDMHLDGMEDYAN